MQICIRINKIKGRYLFFATCFEQIGCFVCILLKIIDCRAWTMIGKIYIMPSILLILFWVVGLVLICLLLDILIFLGISPSLIAKVSYCFRFSQDLKYSPLFWNSFSYLMFLSDSAVGFTFLRREVSSFLCDFGYQVFFILFLYINSIYC